ncbi:hypothetical protein PVL29_024531 [Vitis rotundifolia]|uniref:ADP-ribosyl cyclase/cyclic ADP-ribose hydrolase n=1 Tax=Vitis rotundifolia TaxID=103349 RepID=A0AA38YS76_VITRO|nr:hypothetical protein PVL29_024531 [Vitis rotundifolia]
MASASTQRFSFSSIYDVFLSFRGEDTRCHFTDHLYSALIGNGVHTFRDHEELERGGAIAPGLLKAIEQSRISIVVFSENYAQSRWCLDELVKIIECRTEREQIVLPVFYHVDPSHVRKQMGSYGEAFAYHEKDADLKKREKIQKWRTALTETSNLSSWRLLDNQSESVVIEEITDNIITRLNPKSLYVGENIVGMNIRLEKLRSLIDIYLNKVRMVGICGIGGIDLKSIQGVSFLANVREKSEYDFGLLQLQQQLLNDILKRKNREISNVHEGMNVIKNELSLRRVLVVLDDVDNLTQLIHLVGKHDWFGQGSRILITTRDRHLLDAHGVDKPYHEIEELNSKEALQLFSLYAFKQNFPQEDYKDLLDRMVKYAIGLPLALQVLGSHLCKKTPSEWESELRKLEREPAPEIQNVLKISFHGLDHTQREIFLDIACFFKGQDKDFVSRILDGCDFYAESGFRVLRDRCLIIILDNKIHMHDLIQQMGWQIVREQYHKEPGKWSRLWEPNNVSHVLTRNTGTEAIEGIFLDMSTSEQMQFTTKAFKMMNKLRLLKVHQDAKYDSMVFSWMLVDPSKVLLSQEHFCRDFEFPSQELRYLHWDGYPLESLPSNFYAKNLVELNLRCSNIKQLWETELFKKLKVINLSHSKHLKEIPNPSSVPNLEILTLEELLTNFFFLILIGCMNLESLPRSIYKLRRLKISVLYLDDTAIVKLPSSIKHLKGLEYLTLVKCDDLITVPQSICNLTSLKLLDFSSCSKLEKLPEDLKSLKCLETLSLHAVNCQLPSLSGLCSLRKLYLDRSNLTQGVIQSNNLLNSLKVLDLSRSNVIDKGILVRICHLSSLEELNLKNCNLMEGEIPSEVCQLSSLEILDLSWNHFNSIPASISQLSKLKALGLSHCKMLQQIPELPSTLRLLDAHNSHCALSIPSSFLPSSFSKFQDFECSSSSQVYLCDSPYYFGEGVCIVIPGISGIPEWIMDQNMGNHVTIDLPQDWYADKDFLGFALCSAYVPLDNESEDDFEHGLEDKSEIQSENEPDHDEWAHKSEDESENGSTYKSDYKSEDAFEDEDLAPCSLQCELTFLGDQLAFLDYLSLESRCECYENDGASGQVWVLYYPKVAIEEKYHSNKWRRLKASFYGFFNGVLVKVEKCGMQLIYAKNDEYNHLTLR